MKKNGFIATSILYSFFLVFITLFVALITNYLHNQVLLGAVDELAKDTLNGINSRKFSDLKIGDQVRFANNPTPKTVNGRALTFALNDTASWIVGHIVPNGSKKTYYLLSDFSAQNAVVTRKMPSDPIALRHSVTIEVMNFLSTTNGDGYVDDLYFYNEGISRGVFSRNDFKIYIPKASILSEIRDSNTPDNIKDAILGVDGDYAVYIDNGSYGGFSPGSYALLRRYNFPMGSVQGDFIPKYCSSSYDGSKVTYSGNNATGSKGFGYTHVVDESVNKSGTIKSYVDYCTFASSTPYTHLAGEKVVTTNEENKTDLISEYFRAVTYQYRLMAEITVDENSEFTYISGGRGTSIDPYLITNGVKQE